jgi:protein SCO1/2
MRFAMRRYLLLIGLGLLAGLLIAAGMSITRPYSFHGSLIQPPFPAPAITLPYGDSGTFRLADQTGRVVLIFFGFTHCPDVCPTTLASFTQIHQRLGKDAGRVDFVFITVDPDRDIPQVSSQYAAGFDPTFIGLSGTEQQLAPVWKDYGVYRKLDKTSPNDTTYDVEHSSQVYLVDSSGSLRLTYAYGTPVDDMLQDIRHVLK